MVTWYKSSETSDVAITTGIQSSQSRHKDRTIQVTSILTYTALREDAGYRVFCRATNGGDTVHSTSRPQLDIVYPPTDGPVIEGLPDAGVYTMIRGSSNQQRLTCSVTGGNPLPTLSWNCYVGTHNGSKQGNIVTRTVYWTAGVNKDSTCTCTALHTETSWTRTTSVSVIVLYRSAIIAFYVNPAQQNMTAEASEGSPLKLTCVTDSNPLANITMKRNGVTVQEMSSVRQIEYIKPNSSCENDMGEYSCLSQNELNQSPEMKILHYYVLCKPRLSPFAKLIENVTGSLLSSVDFSVTVVAYPAPVYTWQKFGESGWKDVKLSARISIFTSDDQSQSNVSISKIQEADFGSYRVLANNSQGGIYIMLYFSMASSRPDTPRYFFYTQPLHPQDTAMFYWLTGYNGGFMQTLYIEYKQIEFPRWDRVSVVEDKSVLLMNFTVENLSPATDYQARIYAINKIGISDISDTITFTTLDSKTCATQRAVSQIGSIVAGVVPGIILVGVIAVLVYLRLTYQCTKKGEESRAAVYEDVSGKNEITKQAYEGLQSANASKTSDKDNPENAPKTHYEALTPDQRPTGEYSSLQIQLSRERRVKHSKTLRTNDIEMQEESAYENTKET
ncbi:hypothetical protein DPMN_091025 [Dreissena polymorpha]|uniref:Uncharacterized protein n=1 Tax=Dreissena polymorpha TaxID=45954 RepID=A0A9D4KYT7_DREPO|nr:hypothetical protein DPMN_091025 [Dreissena polymorpha]